MSPPEVWGPPTWIFFHTLIEKLNTKSYPFFANQIFSIIYRICKNLPCPTCSKDSTFFLSKIKLKDYKTKEEFKNLFYLFHNWVNNKKKKPLFNYAYIDQYSKLNLGIVLNNFISVYNTKGNMKLLTDSFQRIFIIKDLLIWLKKYKTHFEPLRENINNLIQDHPNNSLQDSNEHHDELLMENNSLQESNEHHDELLMENNSLQESNEHHDELLMENNSLQESNEQPNELLMENNSLQESNKQPNELLMENNSLQDSNEQPNELLMENNSLQESNEQLDELSEEQPIQKTKKQKGKKRKNN